MEGVSERVGVYTIWFVVDEISFKCQFSRAIGVTVTLCVKMGCTFDKEEINVRL